MTKLVAALCTVLSLGLGATVWVQLDHARALEARRLPPVLVEQVGEKNKDTEREDDRCVREYRRCSATCMRQHGKVHWLVRDECLAKCSTKATECMSGRPYPP